MTHLYAFTDPARRANDPTQQKSSETAENRILIIFHAFYAP